MKARFPSLMLSLVPVLGFGQLVLDSTMTPEQLVQNVLLGSGVSVSNVTFNGLPATSLSQQAMAFDGSNCNIGMSAGLMLSSGNCAVGLGPNNNSAATIPAGGWYNPGDADLSLACGYTTYDAAVLEFDFVPNGDTLRFNYVFGSDEYLEWVGTPYNDIFGFFLSGPGISGPYSGGAINIALIPGTTIPVTISSLNSTSYSMYYVDNGDGFTPPMSTDSTYIQYDGFTTVLEAFALVTCGLSYHIKLAISDANDAILDSGVFLEAGSFTSTAAVTASLATTVGLIDSTLYEGCAQAVLSFTRYAGFNTIDTVQLAVAGTATNGVDFSPLLPPEIVFQVGDTSINYVLAAPVDPDLLETVDVTISNVAQCSGMVVVTNFVFYINEAQPMYITVADTAIGCDDFVTIGPTVFEGYGNYGYIWNTGDNTPTITVSPPVTTTYTVTVTDTCGIIPQSGSITVTVPVYPPVSISVSNDTSIACLQSAVLQVNAAGGDGVYTYEWTDAFGNVLGTGSSLLVTSGPAATYYVDVQAGCGFGAQDSVVVTPLPLPPIVVTTNNDTTVLCTGDLVDLMVINVTGGNGVYSYSWTDAGGNVIDTTTVVSGIVVGDTATYSIQVDDQCGNTGFDNITVYIPQYAPFILEVVSDTAICLDGTTTIWAQATGGAGGYLYDWPDIPSHDSSNTFSPTSPATYTVTVTDQCGSVLTDEVFVDVQYVTALFQINYTGEYDVDFYNLSTVNSTQFLWEFGDGEQTETFHAAHHYIDTEDHIVWLTVWNPLGCVDSISMLVQPQAHLYMPNAFSPDGDGFNDFFGPVGHDIDEFELRIFDRWGEVIYSTNDPTKPWDGKVGGDMAQNGVYVWKLRAHGRRFGPVEYIGSVSLIK